MEAYSMDLRERVIEAYDAGHGSSRELAEVFDVSGAWIRKLLWLRRETGTVAAKEYRRGPRPRLNEQQLARLAKLVDQYPDATLADLRRRLRIDCSLVTIHRALKKLDLSYKKSRSAPASRTART
jgi:transposase